MLYFRYLRYALAKELYPVTVKLKATLLYFIASRLENVLNVAMLAHKTLKNIAKQTVISEQVTGLEFVYKIPIHIPQLLSKQQARNISII